MSYPGDDISRRALLRGSSLGFGALAFDALFGCARPAAAPAPRVRARNVIFCYMSGGVSHVDSFDPKPKLEELRRLPLVGGFLTEERVADLRAQVVRGISDQREVLFEELERAVEEGLDVRALVTEKVREFPIARLEELILEVARRELRAIELLGGLLGLLVGLAQAGLLEWLA